MRVLLSLVIMVGQITFSVPVARAADTTSGGVVIAQMYPGAAGAATQEYIELYNNADIATDVTGWCVQYVSSTGGSTKKLGCFAATNTDTTLWLDPGGYALFASDDAKDTLSVAADGYFVGGISASHGYIRIVDAGNTVVDTLGWGDLDGAVYPDYTAAIAPANGKALQRETTDFRLQDTDNDANDFINSDPLVHASGVYEKQVITDVCPNLPDAQATMPAGDLYDENGDCQPDSCLNIDGLQLTVPDGYDADTSRNCTPHDECDNLPDVQAAIPNYMVRGSGHDCVIDYSPLELTEILPNAEGSDIGNEFIEIYNPGDTTIDLTYYAVKIGSSDKIYSFPVDSSIGPGEYRSFSDSEMKFTLVNSSSRIVLTAIGGAVFGDTAYDSPAEGESWALINSDWQYTNRPTPGAENLASIAIADDSASDASSPKPCHADQYRNPDTGRCRKIETKTVTPCKPGQSRNPETNRCRSVLGASTERKPCAKNQYRSEDTGRCRNLPTSTVPDAAFAVQPVKSDGTVFVGWWALGGVGLLAVGYGAWEWHRELAIAGQKIIRRFHK